MADRDWKSDYFRELAVHEQDAKRWSQIDSLLRRTVSRLALASEGLSEELDQRSEALRRILKNSSDDVTELQAELDALTDLLGRTDQGAHERRNMFAADGLAQLIGRIQWPRSLRKDAYALRKQLGRARYPAEVQQHLPAIFSLIDSVRVEARTGQVNGGSSSLVRQWLARVLGQEDKLLAAMRRLLRVARSRFDIPAAATESIDTRLSDMETLNSSDLALLADGLSELLMSEASGGAIPKLSNSSPVGLNDILTSLLDQLSLPEAQHRDLESLRERLRGPLLPGEWPEVLEDIAELVTQMRESVELEKRDLEKFLTEVMVSLQDLDVTLQGTATQQSQSHKEGTALSEAFASGVRDITDSMAKITDVEQLKKIVQVRLDKIRDHMDTFRDSESARYKEQEEHMHQLMNRLHELEAETETLRLRVSEQRAKALRDPLTGIFNRLAYDERIEQEFLRYKRFRHPLTLMVWDIDRFKQINDEHGHKVGDRVLMAVAQLLASQIRESDFIARYGGEEFVIIATGTPARDALVLADKLREKAALKKFRYQETDIPVTISCGIAEFSQGASPDDVFSAADEALYQAKQSGRNCCKLALAPTTPEAAV